MGRTARILILMSLPPSKRKDGKKGHRADTKPLTGAPPPRAESQRPARVRARQTPVRAGIRGLSSARPDVAGPREVDGDACGGSGSCPGPWQTQGRTPVPPAPRSARREPHPPGPSEAGRAGPARGSQGSSSSWSPGTLPSQPRVRRCRGVGRPTLPGRDDPRPLPPRIPSRTALSRCDQMLRFRPRQSPGGGARLSPRSGTVLSAQQPYAPSWSVVHGAGRRAPPWAAPSAAKGASGRRIYPSQSCRLSSPVPSKSTFNSLLCLGGRGSRLGRPPPKKEQAGSPGGPD